jgi:hypothetical protein
VRTVTGLGPLSAGNGGEPVILIDDRVGSADLIGHL